MADREDLKRRVCAAADEAAPQVREYALDIASHAELGFFETRTSQKLASALESFGLCVRRGLARTGIRADIGTNPGPRVAVIGELDGLVCRGWEMSDPVTGASHTCGHNLQTSMLLAAGYALAKSRVLDELDGSAALIGTPAEEFIEIGMRNKLRESGEIRYLCGKPEMVNLGVFDDIDMAMMVHAGDFSAGAGFQMPYHSNGFRVFMVRYEGRAAHAGASPDKGINALNAAAIGILAANSLRETFRDEDHVRLNFIITKGGDTVNAIPEDVRLEGYVRASCMEVIDSVFARVERAFRAGADATGCTFHFRSIPGDMPLAADAAFNDLFAKNAVPFVGAENIAPSYLAASTDMGDLCHLMPGICPSAGGSLGPMHSASFRVTDFDAAVMIPAKVMLCTIVDLLFDGAAKAGEIISGFRPVYDRQSYLASMDARFVEY